MDTVIKNYLEQIKVGRKQSHKNLALYPLLSTYSSGLEYLLLDEALSDELINLAIKRYDAILATKMKPAIAVLSDSLFLLPFQALFQRGTAFAIMGYFEEAVKDMQSLLTWLHEGDRSDFRQFYEKLEQEVSGCLNIL